MKILFLDIDGVLTCGRIGSVLSVALGQNLARIVQETRAKIVLTSDRRRYDGLYNDLRRFLWHQLRLTLLGKTPIIDGTTRTEEIRQWLMDNKSQGVKKFAILDDDLTGSGFDSNYFQISALEGLTAEDADQVIQFLNG